MTTRPNSQRTLKDILSHLSFTDACKLLGNRGASLIREGGRFDIDFDTQVHLSSKKFRLELVESEFIVVTFKHDPQAKQQLAWACSQCHTACAHVGAAFSLVLEEKTALGLAAPPIDSGPIVELTDAELIEQELNAREERARDESMKVRAENPNVPWTDYQVTNKASGKTYRVALRGMQPGLSFCSCPDYRKNTLGTCKHIIHVQSKVRRKFKANKLKRGFRLRQIIVYLAYGAELELRLDAPSKLTTKVEKIVKPHRNKVLRNLPALLNSLASLEKIGQPVTVYPDAEAFIQRQCVRDRLQRSLAQMRKAPEKHPLRTRLLKVELLPYQLDGIAFAAGAGRAILADDMGLGKTIQGIGVAELLARKANVRRVLVICPASLKAQWRVEILRFSDRDVQLVLGTAGERAEQYNNDAFFTVCNYEQVLRDVMPIEQVAWDLIILDEGQRIKNWQAKTSKVIKSLKSPYALVLSGTPMENKLDELLSVVEFIDDRRLGAEFRFYQHHRVTDDRGKIIGYRNLATLRKNLRPILLRRTREAVLGELPPRTTEVVRITPTDEQREMHVAHMKIVLSITRKSFITEMDLLKLQKALLMCRMVADSTTLVDKQSPGYSSKLQVIDDLLKRFAADGTGKAVLFSEWTTMLSMIEELLNKHGIDFVRLDGSVPQRQRAQLVRHFEQDDSCRFFITTNAGSTGLNLQFASTVINVDLPWTPALLEQRIGRVHRMGQKNPVQVFVLVTEATIEENLLATLAAKHELALAALDADSTVDEVDLVSGMEALKKRLEVLLGAKPEAPIDESQLEASAQEGSAIAEKERLATAGGQLLSAAFDLLGETVPGHVDTDASAQLATELRQRLSHCVETDDKGHARLIVTLPDKQVVDKFANTLAQIMASTLQPAQPADSGAISGCDSCLPRTTESAG